MQSSGIRSFSGRHLVMIYIAWWIIWMVVQTFVLYNTGLLDLESATIDAAVTTVILGLGGYVMISSLRFYRPRQVMQLVWSVGLSLVCILLIRWVALQVVSETAYPEFLEKTMIIRGLFSWLMISIIAIVSWIWFYLREQQEIEDRKLSMEKLAREAELSSLRQQLQPHFLFNSLNSISALVGTKPELARKMIQELSEFLRGTIRKDDQLHVSLEEELNHLNLYLEIEKVRFGHRLKTEIIREESTKRMVLPSLLLQPLFENSIKFGLYDTIGEITIRLKATAADNHLCISIENPFDPETSQPKSGTGFGLTSVQRRLYLLYNRSDLLTTRHSGSIFTTELKIPQPV